MFYTINIQKKLTNSIFPLFLIRGHCIYMLKKRQDGTKYYYYYKKKRGRPKKRGPKPKKKKRGRSWQEKWNFKIVKTSFNKQTEYVGLFHNAVEVEKVKQALIEKNNQVAFPKVFLNNDRTANNTHNSVELKNEYVILERISTSKTSPITRLQNEYGKFIEHETTSSEWKIYDKIPILEEETFWVYGFHPKRERKTFQWIYDNLIVEKQTINTDTYLRVFIYKNKVFIKDDNQNLDFVICKNPSDAIRMYNLLLKWIQESKNKKVFFLGEVETCSDRGRELIKQVQELTGWSSYKIRLKIT